MTELPFINSTANPSLCQGRITKSLKKFGISRIRFDDDFESGILKLDFIYQKMPISIPINYFELGRIFIKSKTYPNKEKLRKTAYKAANSILDSYVKSMLLIIQSGAFTFEEVFLPYFMIDNNTTVKDHIIPKLEQITSGQFLIPEKLVQLNEK